MKLNRTRARFFSLPIAMLVLVSLCLAPCAFGQQSAPELPKAKQTSLGLYVTAIEAHEMWQANQEQIMLLDVRTFEEYVLIGHGQMAVNIPLAFPSYKWDAGKGNFFTLLGNFIDELLATDRSCKGLANIDVVEGESMDVEGAYCGRCNGGGMNSSFFIECGNGI